jgi:hypothetical protein
MTHGKETRIQIANRMLESFAPGTWLRLESGYVLVEWKNRALATISKRWMTRGQDFYPVWNRQWTGGGTACTALSQLVRWVQGKPVLPASTWRYWAGEKCKLLRHGNWEARLRELTDAGYPDVAKCVLCGNEISGGMDWWSLDGISGPCCSMRSGCRQERNDVSPVEKVVYALPGE